MTVLLSFLSTTYQGSPFFQFLLTSSSLPSELSLAPSFWVLSTNSLDFLGGSDGKESVCNMGDLGSIPGLGRCPGEGNGYPSIHGMAKSQTHLSDFHFYFHSPWGHQRVGHDWATFGFTYIDMPPECTLNRPLPAAPYSHGGLCSKLPYLYGHLCYWQSHSFIRTVHSTLQNFLSFFLFK